MGGQLMRVEDFVNEFISKMLEWENERRSYIRSSDYKKNVDGARDSFNRKCHDRLAEIIAKYLSPKAAETLGKSKLITMGVGNPPIYDQSIESAESKGSKAKVICKSNNGALPDAVVRYGLIKSGDGWLIDEVHSSSDKAKWRKNNSI